MTKDLTISKEYVEHARRIEYLESVILGSIGGVSHPPAHLLERIQAINGVLGDLMNELAKQSWPPFEE